MLCFVMFLFFFGCVWLVVTFELGLFFVSCLIWHVILQNLFVDNYDCQHIIYVLCWVLVWLIFFFHYALVCRCSFYIFAFCEFGICLLRLKFGFDLLIIVYVNIFFCEFSIGHVYFCLCFVLVYFEKIRWYLVFEHTVYCCLVIIVAYSY